MTELPVGAGTGGLSRTFCLIYGHFYLELQGGFNLMWPIVIALSVELMRALELKVAVEFSSNDYRDTRCLLSANQSQMQASSLAVVSIYIEESWRAVSQIVAQ